MNLINRPRRLRTSPTLRSMMRETRMSPSSLIYPIFAIEGENIKNPIASLPGQFQWSPDRICEAIEECMQAGVEKVMLFGLPAHKDEIGSGAWAENGIVQQAIRAIKAKYPDQLLMADCDNFENAMACAEAGADFVGTTMRGYTPETQGINDIDFAFVHKLAAECPAKIIAEGHIHYPEQAVKALEAGAFALVVGGAITRPAEITARFTGAINAMNH